MCSITTHASRPRLICRLLSGPVESQHTMIENPH
jgi:hypothetical protein